MSMRAITDYHTHILPNMDDGSVSVEMSLEMLRLESEQGIEKVIMTPHFYANHESPDSFISRRDASEKVLRDAIKICGYNCPEIVMGAEVKFFEGISTSECLPSLAIEGTKCVLIEMPIGKWSDRMMRELENIYKNRKLIPIIAHIDRYVSFGIVEDIFVMPVMIQANASFFTDVFTRRKALSMLKKGYIHLLGSDAHNLKKRSPNLGEAISVVEKKLGVKALEYIKSNEMKLVCGENPQNQ